MPPTLPIIVIADDLSGAAELAGIAFAHGLSAEVQREFEPSSDSQVIAIDTDSRHLSAVAAAGRVQGITQEVARTNPVWIFKKVDSVLRGNPRAEIEAVLRATGQSRAILIPANPTRGRMITNGRYLIDGVPLDQTPFAHDPDHPRRSADVRTLLGGTGQDQIHTLHRTAPLPDSGIIVPDVISETELAKIAHTMPPSTLPAGAADFFSALLRERYEPVSSAAQSLSPVLNAPVLLVCGSRTSWPARLAQCLAAGIPVVTIDQSVNEIASTGTLLLGIGEATNQIDQANALSQLADIAAVVIDRCHVKTLLAEGGATAAASANRLGWSRFQVSELAPSGVGALRPLTPNAPLVLIKPGSYPWPSEIWQSFCAAAAN